MTSMDVFFACLCMRVCACVCVCVCVHLSPLNRRCHLKELINWLKFRNISTSLQLRWDIFYTHFCQIKLRAKVSANNVIRNNRKVTVSFHHRCIVGETILANCGVIAFCYIGRREHTALDDSDVLATNILITDFYCICNYVIKPNTSIY